MAAFQEPESLSMERAAYGDLQLRHAPNRGLCMELLAREIIGLLNCTIKISLIPNGREQRNGCDWFEDDCAVECKSAKLSWDVSRQCWYAKFQWVKFDCFDRLLLVLYSPRAIYIYEYHGFAGRSTNGDSTPISGGKIVMRGPSWERQWAAALDHVLAKLEAGGSKLLAVVDWLS